MLNDDLKTLESEIKFSRPKYMNSQTVKPFEGGKYKNNVCKVYIQLFTMNVVVKSMLVKSPLGLLLYCYLNMPTINKTYLILFYLSS
jgi:hypothetical protein